MRIDEINERMASIEKELESATGDDLTTLETEVATLTEERNAILAETEKKQQLRAAVAERKVGNPMPESVVAPAAPEMTVAQKEERAFADYVRGLSAQLRTNEQKFDATNVAATLPTTIAQRVISAVRERCPILAGAELFQVNGTLKIPVYGKKTVSETEHDITVAYASEFEELTADSGAFTSVDLTGYLIGVLTLIGKSEINNSAIDLVSFVVDKMGEKIATFVEGELLNGTESKCTGALSTSNTMNAGSVSAVSADNLIDLQAKIKTVYQANACWTMHPNTFTAVKKLKDGNGQYLVSTDFSSAFPYRILGKPVYLSDNMPTIASAAKAILYGDYSGLAVNIRENISIEILREKYATQHAIGIVGWMEMDSKVQNAQKLATLTMSVG